MKENKNDGMKKRKKWWLIPTIIGGVILLTIIGAASNEIEGSAGEISKETSVKETVFSRNSASKIEVNEETENPLDETEMPETEKQTEAISETELTETETEPETTDALETTPAPTVAPTQAPTAAPTTVAPTQAPTIVAPTTNVPETTSPKVVYVWIAGSGNGKCYHSHSDCSRMKNPRCITLEEAKGKGYQPCKNCYGN